MIKKSVFVLCLLLSVPLFADSSDLPTVKLNGFLQTQLIYDQSDGEVDDFLIPRARIGAKGVVTNNISYNLAIGATEAPDSEPHLVNAYIDLHHISNVVVRIGQSLLPFGLEGSQTIPENPDIDRSTTVGKLNVFSLYRDRGVQLRGTQGNLDYGVAVVNGSGANSRDDSSTKDFLGQVRYEVVPGLKLGASAHSGSVTEVTDVLKRSRFGLDAEWKKSRSLVRGEYISLTRDASSDVETTASGWYVLGSSAIRPNWIGVLRYEHYRPDVNMSGNVLSIATLTAHYLLTDTSKVSVSLAIQDDESDPGLRNKITTQMMMLF